MTPEQFEQLLYESESETLDFKEKQYAFSDATDKQKSELLKDILGFANAWRRSDAFVLIGVREVSGDRSVVVGIEEHLPDHSLQQFVNTKTNCPVQFSYKAIVFDGKQVGVITIYQQGRPFWLSKDYGRLKKDEVYVRRGSSTDPTRPASLDEVSKMMRATAPRTTSVEVQFCDPKNSRLLGASLQMEGPFMRFPSGDELPPLSIARSRVGMGHMLRETNAEYYREVAAYCHRHQNFQPMQLAVTNTGEVSAEDVRIEFHLPTSPGLEMLEEWEMNRDFPQKDYDRMDSLSISSAIAAGISKRDGDVAIVRDSDSLMLEVEYRKIQPGRTVLTDKFYVACRQSGTVALAGKVFSKNLPQPVDVELSIEFNVSPEEVERERFLEWADNPQKTEEE